MSTGSRTGPRSSTRWRPSEADADGALPQSTVHPDVPPDAGRRDRAAPHRTAHPRQPARVPALLRPGSASRPHTGGRDGDEHAGAPVGRPTTRSRPRPKARGTRSSDPRRARRRSATSRRPSPSSPTSWSRIRRVGWSAPPRRLRTRWSWTSPDASGSNGLSQAATSRWGRRWSVRSRRNGSSPWPCRYAPTTARSPRCSRRACPSCASRSCSPASCSARGTSSRSRTPSGGSWRARATRPLGGKIPPAGDRGPRGHRAGLHRHGGRGRGGHAARVGVRPDSRVRVDGPWRHPHRGGARAGHAECPRPDHPGRPHPPPGRCARLPGAVSHHELPGAPRAVHGVRGRRPQHRHSARLARRDRRARATLQSHAARAVPRRAGGAPRQGAVPLDGRERGARHLRLHGGRLLPRGQSRLRLAHGLRECRGADRHRSRSALPRSVAALDPRGGIPRRRPRGRARARLAAQGRHTGDRAPARKGGAGRGIAARVRDHGGGRHGAEAARGAAQHHPEDGGGRASRGWARPRLQQRSHRDPRERRAHRLRAGGIACGAREHQGDRARHGGRPTPDPAAPLVQPGAAGRAEPRARQRRDPRRGDHAVPPHRRGRAPRGEPRPVGPLRAHRRQPARAGAHEPGGERQGRPPFRRPYRRDLPSGHGGPCERGKPSRATTRERGSC